MNFYYYRLKVQARGTRRRMQSTKELPRRDQAEPDRLGRQVSRVARANRRSSSEFERVQSQIHRENESNRL